jgi:phenylpropionate dioxygenase-like ring-hydroxylating dioxygenase large terminal subunit
VSDIDRWFPIARSEEVIPRYVVQAQLLGQEIALWRDDGGAMNAWENRCPHRGVRLSIGFNTGMDLRCQYHGWRFATGSGQCTYIPAHPNQKPAAAMRATLYACAERHGFVWASLGLRAEPSAMPDVPAPRTITLRSLYVAAPASAIAAALTHTYKVAAQNVFTLRTPDGIDDADAVTFFLQPMTESQTMVHGVLHAQPADSERLAVLRRHNARLTTLRDAVQAKPRTMGAVTRARAATGGTER